MSEEIREPSPLDLASRCFLDARKSFLEAAAEKDFGARPDGEQKRILAIMRDPDVLESFDGLSCALARRIEDFRNSMVPVKYPAANLSYQFRRAEKRGTTETFLRENAMGVEVVYQGIISGIQTETKGVELIALNQREISLYAAAGGPVAREAAGVSALLAEALSGSTAVYEHLRAYGALFEDARAAGLAYLPRGFGAPPAAKGPNFGGN